MNFKIETEHSGVKLIIKAASFLAIATALVLGTFVLSGPHGGAVEAHEEMSAPECSRQQVALDEGYGVSRVEWRTVCGN
ncbi:MAG: hypothetical protein JWL62_3712 [Hyphomicrobiales bacterium]|nr:hypothetical protein [Hyphomicrobiales bacterium]